MGHEPTDRASLRAGQSSNIRDPFRIWLSWSAFAEGGRMAIVDDYGAIAPSRGACANSIRPPARMTT
jgi:hypothetical protein